MNEHEIKNRRAKAEAIATYLITQVFNEHPCVTDVTIQVYRDSPQGVRDIYARCAGQRSPSPATWTQAMDLVDAALKPPVAA